MSYTAAALPEIYTDLSGAGAYGGVDRVYREARRLGHKVSRREVREFLQNTVAYTLHRPARRNFPRNQTNVFYIDEVWQMDLVELRGLGRYNRGMKYILVGIDVFSKYAFAEAMPDKAGPTVLQAFKTILKKSGRRPSKIHTDLGKEFIQKPFQQYLKSLGIRFFSTFSETKASVVERFNRTLKERMFEYFSDKNTYNYVDVLDRIIDGYNRTPHRSIGYNRPVDVTPATQLKIWKKYHKPKRLQEGYKFKFKVGDAVRISRDKGVFGKGYEDTFSEEYFIVTQRLMRMPPAYRIKDLMDEEIKGVFYEYQLQKINPPEYFVVEKVLQKRGNRYLVKWRGFPSKFNQWVNKEDVAYMTGKDVDTV